MTTLHTLASGSSGNSSLLTREHTNVLLDAGISCRRITVVLRNLGLSLTDLSAVFITHTHSDHISGMQTLSKHCDVPVFASEQTCRELARRVAGISPRLCPFSRYETLRVGAFTVTPFPTSHDAPGSSGYRFDNIGVLTDSGYVTDEARETLEGCQTLVLEANHDVERLCNGPYPYFLKRRILSAEGHLSNDAAAAFAVMEAHSGTKEIILAHLSAENNTPELALSAVCGALKTSGLSSRVTVAPRNDVSVCYQTEEPCSESPFCALEN